MTRDPNHPLVPVFRRVLERRGIIRFYDGSRIEIETLSDDTERDEMTVIAWVTLADGTGEVHKIGPITCTGQGSVSDEQWLRDWTGALTQLFKDAAARAAARRIEDAMRLAGAKARNLCG